MLLNSNNLRHLLSRLSTGLRVVLRGHVHFESFNPFEGWSNPVIRLIGILTMHVQYNGVRTDREAICIRYVRQVLDGDG
jgi:hypothetical protein